MAAMSNMSPQALAAWEQLNATWGKPLTVNSAYRDPAQNAAAGGAKRSQHMHGNAFDVSTAGMSQEDRAALVQAAKSSGFTGYGGYNNSLHFDVGPSRTWGADYTGATTPDWLTSALGDGTPATQGRTSTRGSQPMTPTQQAPKGILEMMGIQKRDPSAQDQTALPFYQRDQFKNTMGNIAVAANTLRQSPDENIPAMVQANRQQRDAEQSRNKTVEYLRANGREDLASMVEQGMISGQDAAGQLLAKPKDNRTAAMQNYEFLTAQGMPSQTAMERAFGGTAPTINIGQGGGKFEEAFAKGDADALAEVSVAGMQAMRNMGRIDELDRLLQAAPTGGVGYLKGLAGEYGINTEGLDDIQAATALINSLVPEQRQPGSGPMSDADLELFKQSLPRIINQPGGNALIVSTMRAINDYDAQGAKIVQQLRAGKIDRPTAFQMLQGRQNPLSGFKPPAAASQDGPPAAGAPVNTINSILGG